MLKNALLLAIATSLIWTFPAEVAAQAGSPEEQAARRHCWQQYGIPLNMGPMSEESARRLVRCVTERLGRPDPYMTQRYGTGK